MSSKTNSRKNDLVYATISPEDRSLFREAWETTRKIHGHTMTFYLPGMVRYDNLRGKFPAVSITGNRCELQCEHCKGKLLEPMLKADSPDRLIKVARRLSENGAYGLLLTGGSDKRGELPWPEYSEAMKTLKKETGLYLSAHTGFPGKESCRLLKAAGIEQALIDVMGDKETASRIYHLDGLGPLFNALDGLKENSMELAPHIVAGLYYGKMRAERNALGIVRSYNPSVLVIVVLSPTKGTAMASISPPSPLEIGKLIARARISMPEVPISLGCERPRNKTGWAMERLAIRAGATRMAVWSEAAIDEARKLGLRTRFQGTCCSLDFRNEMAISSQSSR